MEHVASVLLVKFYPTLVANQWFIKFSSIVEDIPKRTKVWSNQCLPPCTAVRDVHEQDVPTWMTAGRCLPNGLYANLTTPSVVGSHGNIHACSASSKLYTKECFLKFNRLRAATVQVRLTVIPRTCTGPCKSPLRLWDLLQSRSRSS